jgi:hypothetical protein
VAVDSLDWLERLIFDAVCREYGVRSIEKADGGYGRGYTHALTHWNRIIALLEELRGRRGMLVVLIAHAKVERFEDPESAAYDRYTPRLNKHAASLIAEWADAVLFATRRFRVQKENSGFAERGIAAPVGADGANASSAPSALRRAWRKTATVCRAKFRSRGARSSPPCRRRRRKPVGKCQAVCEVFSRVCGYFRPVSNWNKGKREEFKERKVFDVRGLKEKKEEEKT